MTLSTSWYITCYCSREFQKNLKNKNLNFKPKFFLKIIGIWTCHQQKSCRSMKNFPINFKSSRTMVKSKRYTFFNKPCHNLHFTQNWIQICKLQKTHSSLIQQLLHTNWTPITDSTAAPHWLKTHHWFNSCSTLIEHPPYYYKKNQSINNSAFQNQSSIVQSFKNSITIPKSTSAIIKSAFHTSVLKNQPNHHNVLAFIKSALIQHIPSKFFINLH